jgi:GntR family transcriptional repressor for pyruvate dehydrogenase complex
MTRNAQIIELGPYPEAEKKGGLVTQVIAKVQEYIREHNLTVGDSLPSETAFAEAFGVSRVVMRESYRALAAIGLIDVANGRRTRLAAVNSDVLAVIIDHAVHIEQMSIQHIYELRRTLEGRTVTLAALRRSDGEAKTIFGHAAAMRAHFDKAELVMRHDIAFHAAITAASRNPSFILVLGSFDKVTRQSWPIGWRSRATDQLRMETVECHEAIARAIMAGDASAAQESMAEHFDMSVKALVAAGMI